MYSYYTLDNSMGWSIDRSASLSSAHLFSSFCMCVCVCVCKSQFSLLLGLSTKSIHSLHLSQQSLKPWNKKIKKYYNYSASQAPSRPDLSYRSTKWQSNEHILLLQLLIGAKVTSSDEFLISPHLWIGNELFFLSISFNETLRHHNQWFLLIFLFQTFYSFFELYI